METVNKTINHVKNLPKTKKIILVIIVLVVLLFIYDIIRSYKQHYGNPKKIISKKIEKLENAVSTNSTTLKMDTGLELNTEKTNVTLYFADWCGHCKQFINSTWTKAVETFDNNNDIVLNQVDCTNIQTEIKTPAGNSIKGFPTVIINYKNKDGEYVEEEYNGSRTYDKFSSYIEKFASKQ